MQTPVTHVTAEPIEPGRVARMPMQSGLWPVLIEAVTPRGAVVVRPMNRTGDDWADRRQVSAGDVWFLLDARETAELDLPRGVA